MLFARFHHIYTHKYDSAYSDAQTLNYAKKEWAHSLRDFNQSQIEWAIEQCKDKFAWPPSISEFKEMMQPSAEQLGLPSVRSAYVEACLGAHNPKSFQWSHEVVKQSAKRSEFYSLKSQSESYMLPIFSKHYEKVCAQFFANESFDEEPVKSISNHVHQVDNVDLIEIKVKEHPEIDPNIISNLYYYSLKTINTATREQFREKSIAQAKKLGFALDFPK